MIMFEELSFFTFTDNPSATYKAMAFYVFQVDKSIIFNGNLVFSFYDKKTLVILNLAKCLMRNKYGHHFLFVLHVRFLLVLGSNEWISPNLMLIFFILCANVC